MMVNPGTITYYYVQFKHSKDDEWNMDFNLFGHENFCDALKRLKVLKKYNAGHTYFYRIVQSITITSEVFTDETNNNAGMEERS